MKIALPFIRVTFVCILGIAAAGCGSNTEKLTLGKPCHLNTDCTDPLACKFSTCHRQCVADRDCDVGQRCVKVDGGGVCQLPAEKTCGGGVACQAPLACASDEQCRTSCTTQMDCLGGQMCVSGGAAGANVCAEPTDIPGASTDAGSPGGSGGGGSGGAAGAGTGGAGGSDGGGASGMGGGGAGGITDGGTPMGDGPITTTDGAISDAPVGADGGTTPDAAGTQPDTGTYVAPAGPIVVEVTQASDPVAPSGRELYTIDVGNVSTRSVDMVKVLIRLPAGLQFNGANDAEPNADCFNYNCAPNAEAGWLFPSLAAGERKTIVVNANVLETVGEGDAIALSIGVTATGLSPINVMKTAHAHANPSAGLTLDASKDPVAPNEKFSFDMDVGQLGTAALNGAELRLTVPSGLTVGDISDGGMQSTPGQIVWTMGSVAVGASVHRKVDVTLDPAVPGGAHLKATAVLAFDGGAAADATAERAISAVGVTTPLKLDVSVIGNPSVPGGRVVFKAVVGNTSTRTVDGVSVVLRLPPGLQFNGANDSEPNAGCFNYACAPNGEAPWTIGTLVSGAAATIDVSATVIDTVAGDGTLLTTLWQVFAPGQPTLNLSRTTQVFSHPGAQLYLGSSNDPLTPGQAFSFDVDIGQIGTSALAGSAVRLLVPAGLTVGTISDGGTQASPGEIVWNVGTVAVSTSPHRKVDVTVDGSVLPGTVLTARASLTYDGGLAVDNYAEHTVSVIPVALPLTATVTATPNPVAPGGRVTYTTTVTNGSARAIDSVTVLFRVPAGVHFNGAVDADPDAGCFNYNCYALGEAPWTLGTIPAGTNKVITVNATVDATVLEGSLLSGITRVGGADVANVIDLRTTVAAHK